jgi:FAD/FMN-containing dehydrogenase
VRPVSSWGRLSAARHTVVELADVEEIASRVRGEGPAIARGHGRSYGDSCLNPGGNLWSTAKLDRLHAFDPATGRLVCESGVLLRDIQRLMAPRGWGLPVLPGTQLVSVGGAIANDVHGKNHHRAGTFGDHVRRLRLVRTDGEIVDCGPDRRADWFAATVGGIGLTGIVATAELQLCPMAGPWLDTEIVPYQSLDAFLTLADESEASWEHTVGWLDSTRRGEVRGLFLRARPAEDQSGVPPPVRSFSVPVTPPIGLFNRLSIPAFNALYYAVHQRRAGRRRRAFDSFLFPLDGIGDWNRLYGPRGFYQYQFVVPRPLALAALQEVLDIVAASGQGSFLSVAKTFGDRVGRGLLSFPMPGVTLSLDFANRGAPTEALFERLDTVVRHAGGRLYLAKDARMSSAMFEAGYPNGAELRRFRDPGVSSAMSRRLLGS